METFKNKVLLTIEDENMPYINEVRRVTEKLIAFGYEYFCEVYKNYSTFYFNDYQILIHKYENGYSSFVFLLDEKKEYTPKDMFLLHDIINA